MQPVNGHVTVVGQPHAQAVPVMMPPQTVQQVAYNQVPGQPVYGGVPGVVPGPGIPGGGPPTLTNSYPGVYGPQGPNMYGPSQNLYSYHASVPPTTLPPDITGVGRTAGEIAVEQARNAAENDMYKPQDFKPADDDPSRMYPLRELDGTWTQRNRLTIDHLDCRWFLHEQGYFYAVRLSD